jgi:hypothetical protein
MRSPWFVFWLLLHQKNNTMNSINATFRSGPEGPQIQDFFLPLLVENITLPKFQFQSPIECVCEEVVDAHVHVFWPFDV